MCGIFNRHFIVLILSTFLVVWWGLVRLVTATTALVSKLCFNYCARLVNVSLECQGEGYGGQFLANP
jgi:hypothetical protein